MSSDNDNNETTGKPGQQAEKPAAPPKKRGWIRWLFYSLALLFVAFVVGGALLFHFYANRIFRETFREMVRRETNGSYDLTFDNINIHYLKQEIEITGFKLFPDTLQPANDSLAVPETNNQLTLRIPVFQVKGLDVFKFIRKKELHIRSFFIGQPNIQFVFSRNEDNSSQLIDSLPKQPFHTSQLYGYIRNFLTLVIIRNFEMKDAVAEITDTRTSPGKKFILDNFSLSLYNFLLDSTAHLVPEKFFFTDSLHLQFKNGNSLFTGGKQDIAFQNLDYSSAGKILMVGDLSLKSNPSQAELVSQERFDVSVPGLKITGLDLRQPLDGRMKLDEIVLTQPEISFYPGMANGGNIPSREEMAQRMYNAVSAIFDPLEVGKISVNNAHFALDGFKNEYVDNLSLADVSVVIHHLLVDSANYQARSPYFFVDGLVFTLRNQDLYLKPLQQEVTFDSLVFNTLASTLEAGNVVLKARKTDAPGINADVKLPFLYIESKSITQDFMNNRLNLKEITLQSPDIRLRHRRSAIAGKTSDDFFTLEIRLQKFLKWLKADAIYLKDATFGFDDGEGIFKNQLTAGNINMRMNGFDPGQLRKKDTQPILFSNSVDVQVSDLKIILPDSLHQLHLNSFALNTQDSSIAITGFSMDTLTAGLTGKPGNQGNLPDNLDISNIKLAGIDLYNVYRQKKTRIESVRLDSVNLKMSQGAGTNDTSPVTDSSKGLPGFLKDYRVNDFELSNGFFNFYTIENKPFAEAGNIHLNLQNIRPPENDSVPFSTDLFDLNLKYATYFLPDNQHIIETGKIKILSSDSLISIDNLVLKPINYNNIGNNELVRIELPALSTSGTDIIRIFNEKHLVSATVELLNPDVRIILVPKPGYEKQLPEFPGGRVINNALTTIFPFFDIHSLKINHSRIELFGGKTFNSQIISLNDLSVDVDSFYLNDLTPMAKDNFMFASDIRLNIDKPFRLPMNDTLAFNLEKLELSTKTGTLSTEKIFLNIAPQGNNFVEGQFREEINLELESVDLQGLDFYSLATDKKMEVDNIFIRSADLLIRQNRPEKKKDASSIGTMNLYKLIAPRLRELRVGEIAVDNTFVKFEEKFGNNINIFDFNDVKANINNLLIDSTNRVFEDKFLYSDHLSFSLKDYLYYTKDSLYSIGAGKMSFNSKNSMLTVDSGFMQPLLDDTMFAKKTGVQTDRMQFVFDQARLENLRLIDFILDRKLHIDKILISGMNMDDYRNKNYPFPENHYPNLPGSAIRDLPFAVEVDTLQISNSDFQYREYVYPAIQPGVISFSDMSVTGFNLTNIQSKIEQNPFMLILASGKLMGEGNVNLMLKFDLESKDNYFTAKGIVKKMDLTKMNPLLENVAFVKIKKGVNNQAEFEFSANNDFARGRMKFYYKDLSIRLIDKQTLQSDGFGESVASFIANTFVVRRNNSNKLLYYRIGDIYFIRDKQKSFFNYLAKSSLSGINSTIRGGNEERREKRKKRKLEQELLQQGRLPEEITNPRNPK